ncbi:MAG: hypothetical protein RL748_4138 [Pseudomonadota bacterium]
MKKILLAVALPVVMISCAQAQEKVAAQPVRFLLGTGLTFGGDKLATAYYTNNTSATINAGSGLQLWGGVDYRINPQFSLQGTVGYHTHFTPEASNGDASFSRIPVELLAYYHLNENWRLGGGVRFVSSAKLNGKGAASGLNQKFDDVTGAILEAEYLYGANLGFKVRFVKEEYKATGFNTKFSGDHLGLMMNYYF